MKTSSEESRKKIMIIVAVIAVLVICLAVALTTCGGDEKDSREKTDPNKTAVETEASDDKELTADEKAEKEELEAGAEDPANASTGSSSGSGSGSASKPSTDSSASSSSGSSSSSSGSSGTSGSSSTTEKEKVWVVDVPAVYEREPIYEGGYNGYWIKDFGDNIIYKTTSWAQMEAKMNELASQGNFDWTWGQNLPAEIVGYRDVCVQEEQGHWEYR